MGWVPVVILALQGVLLGCFAFFAFFNYLYGFAALRQSRPATVRPSDERIAVVIVSFNEKHVPRPTVDHCDKLTYPNRVVILSDDSTDSEIVDDLRCLAQSRPACGT